MYLFKEPSQIQRHFVTVSKRRVHYRRAGNGPPLLLLHQSPTSSAEMASSMVAFAEHFTVIAPDTPGYGWSDPLDIADPTMTDYARALVELLDALGIKRSGIYGTHTGAMIAAEFGRLFPKRVTAVLLDGYVVLTDTEREDILAHYFETVSPSGDGRHLSWYWSRIRDQVIFFPWYRKSLDARMRFDVPPANFLQPYLMDLLSADSMGRPAYEAAFRYPSKQAVLEFSAPTYLLNYAQDAIAHHPERLDAVSGAVTRECLADPDKLQQRAIALLLEHAGETKAATAPTEPAHGRHYLHTRHGPLMVDSRGQGQPLLLLHAPGMSSAEWRELPVNTNQYTLHAVDLPGHGGSIGYSEITLPAVLEMLEDVMEAIGEGVQLIALQGSGALALALQARKPELKVSVVGMPFPSDDVSVWPDLQPSDHGGHLLAAWQCVRDAEVFRPWYRPDLAHAFTCELQTDPDRIHARVTDLLRAAPVLPQWQQLLETIDLRSVVRTGQAGLRIIASKGAGAESAAAGLAGLTGNRVENWPLSLQQWDTALLAF